MDERSSHAGYWIIIAALGVGCIGALAFALACRQKVVHSDEIVRSFEARLEKEQRRSYDLELEMARLRRAVPPEAVEAAKSSAPRTGHQAPVTEGQALQAPSPAEDR